MAFTGGLLKVAKLKESTKAGLLAVVSPGAAAGYSAGKSKSESDAREAAAALAARGHTLVGGSIGALVGGGIGRIAERLKRPGSRKIGKSTLIGGAAGSVLGRYLSGKRAHKKITGSD